VQPSRGGCVVSGDRALIQAQAPGQREELRRALLACGHWSDWLHPASSVFDFPMVPVWCGGCRDSRCLDITLQALLLAHEPVPTEEVTP
jgi:hypothetical protein